MSTLRIPNAFLFSFCHSENYIFGKFDAFCKRLEKINDMIDTMTAFSGLQEIKIEGIESIVARYKTIVESVKKKSYDILDHRKTEVNISNKLWSLKN